jgi:cytochrome P450
LQKFVNPTIFYYFFQFSAKFTIDVIASTVFAKDPDSFTRYGCPIRKMVKKLIQPTIISSNSATEKFYTTLMTNAVEHRKSHNTNRADYLNYLLELQEKQGLTNQELAAHGCTFYSSGLENSSILLSFILFEVS